MDDGDLRELCHRFFDALERRDIGEIDSIFSPDLTFWVNVTGNEAPKDHMMKAITEGYARHRRRTYNDRMIDTFDGGFVVQYTLNIVQHDGRKSAFWACLVARCKDNMIVRVDEYLDSGKFTAPLPSQAKDAAE